MISTATVNMAERVYPPFHRAPRLRTPVPESLAASIMTRNTPFKHPNPGPTDVCCLCWKSAAVNSEGKYNALHVDIRQSHWRSYITILRPVLPRVIKKMKKLAKDDPKLKQTKTRTRPTVADLEKLLHWDPEVDGLYMTHATCNSSVKKFCELILGESNLFKDIGGRRTEGGKRKKESGKKTSVKCEGSKPLKRVRVSKEEPKKKNKNKNKKQPVVKEEKKVEEVEPVFTAPFLVDLKPPVACPLPCSSSSSDASDGSVSSGDSASDAGAGSVDTRSTCPLSPVIVDDDDDDDDEPTAAPTDVLDDFPGIDMFDDLELDFFLSEGGDGVGFPPVAVPGADDFANGVGDLELGGLEDILGGL